MKQVIPSMLAAVFFAVTSPVLAWSIEEELRGSKEADKDHPYQGSSGARYEYDLSRPSDQVRYEHDFNAQRRDEMSIDLRRDRDRDRGQYGGGIER